MEFIRSFLLHCPMWAIFAILYFLVVVILLPIRRIFQGVPFNHSFASVYGDTALILAIMVGLEILRKSSADWWVYTVEFHMVALIFGMIFGLCWQVRSGTKDAGDVWHNLVSVPLLIYCLTVTVLPTFGRANYWEKAGMSAFFLFWFFLVLYDLKEGRLTMHHRHQ